MSHFKHHVFVCCNQRDPGEGCCNDLGSSQLHGYMKQRVKDLDLAGDGQIRINKAGCLGRCDSGPVLVVYPEGTWYTYVDQQDIDEIVERHLVQGQVVERLKI